MCARRARGVGVVASSMSLTSLPRGQGVCGGLRMQCGLDHSAALACRFAGKNIQPA